MDLMEPWDPLDHPPRIEIRRQESDDSDAEGGLTNVTRAVLRPPGHSGKAKRGHLSFDASYETGNLGRVDFISEYEYDLFIRPDTSNPRFRMWFNFVVDNVREDQRVIFNIVNFSKSKTRFSQGLTPLVKTTSRPKWQRLGEKYVYYHKSPEHRNHYVLSWAFVFDREEDVYQFAFTFPYSYSRLTTYLGYIQSRNLPFIQFQTVATSLQNRKVQLLKISTSSVPKKPKLVVVMARSHAGESSTSYVAQGLIDFLISSHPVAEILRDHVVIKVIPMVNPDGVFLGNYKTSLMGYDLNRNWNQISSWSHPVLSGLQTLFQELDTNKTLELDMVIDLHAHASLLGTFIYGNSYEDVYRFERHILFPKLLANNCEDYNSAYTMYNRDPLKAGSARRHLCDTLRSSVNVYTLEVSVEGYSKQSHGVSTTIPYTEDGYFRLGRNIGRTFADYYRATGIIPAKAFPLITTSGLENEESKKKQIVRRSRTRSRSRSRPLDDKVHPVLHLPQLTKEDDVYEGDESSDRDSDSTCSQAWQARTEEFKDKEDGEVSPVQLPLNSQKFDLVESNSKNWAYTTFDFSVLTKVAQGGSMNYSNATRGRKVGGGGILGKQRTRRIRKASHKPLSQEEGQSPILTIIDFNKLIRVGHQEGRTEEDSKMKKHPKKREEPEVWTVTKGGRMVSRRTTRRAVGRMPEWENTSSDSESDTVHLPKNSHFDPPQLDSDTGIIHHAQMRLNPRQPKKIKCRKDNHSFTHKPNSSKN